MDVAPGPAGLTPRALASGLAVGAVLCVANLYTGLKIGFWESGHVTASVLAFALASGKLSRVENVAAQTVAVAAGAMPAAAGLLGAIPALDLLHRGVPAWSIGLWGCALALLGILFAAPLRRRLLDEERLPFPTSVAAGEVIEALHLGAREARQKTRPLLYSGAVGLILAWFRDGKPAVLPGAVTAPGSIASIPAATVGAGISTSPLLWGVGMLVGPRIAFSMVIGSAVGWGALAPWLVRGPFHVPAERGAIWNWLSWPGTALLIGAAFVALLQQLAAFTGAVRDLRAVAGARARIERRAVWATAGVLAAVAVLARAVFGLGIAQISLGLVVSVVGAAVCARAAGLTDISPVGPVGQAMQVISGRVTPGAPAINIAAGQMVAGPATHTTALLWSLGTARRLGADAHVLFVAAAAGCAAGAIVCAPAYLFLVRAFGLGSPRLPVPTGVQWKAMAEVAAIGFSALPQGAAAAVAAGAALGVIIAALSTTRVGARLPSPVALGIGLLVPIDYSLAIAAGALLARAIPQFRERSASIGAGLVAGDSLIGVLVALLTSAGAL